MAVRNKVLKYPPNARRTDELDELVVFGYTCKLFRDDERAQFIDEGRHLIPWMGNEGITIDRYDGRGHLFDLRPYDSDFPINCGLSEEELRIEALCDEERYLELHTDLMERAVYEEEELKRLNEAVNDGYQAVGFSYHYSNTYDPSEPTEEQHQEEEEDEPFVVPENLKVPGDMIAPQSVKINAIIEKTALFVSQHGGQMEIVLKTKQHNNPQFNFLYMGDELNPYYRHVVQMIKSGRYVPHPTESRRRDSHPESDPDDDEHSNSGYLHPSLAPKVTTQVIPQQPKGSQIEGTAYAKLLNKLGKQPGQNSPNHAQHIDGAQQDYTRPIQQYVTQGSVFSQSNNLPPPPGMQPAHLHSQPPPPGTVPPQLPSHHSLDLGVATIGPQVIPPPPDQKPVIDRMAGYVIKEGLQFEGQVKSQNDPRFEFLNPWHPHNAYYEQKKKSLAQEILTLLQDENCKIAPKAISFSIKAKEAEVTPIEKKKKAFLFHESSDEEGEGGTSKTVADELDSVMFDQPPPEIVEKKIAEERLKDKLAAAAREKMAQVNKEKQVQAERKKKAALFINMVKNSGEFKETSGHDQPHSRTHSPSPYSSPSQRTRSSSRTHSPSRSPSRRRSRSPAYYRIGHSRSPLQQSRDGSSTKSSKYKSPSPRNKRRKTPPKAFAVSRRSKSKTPPKKRKRRASSSDSDSTKKSSRSLSRKSPSRSRRLHSSHQRSHSGSHRSRSGSQRSDSRSRSSRSDNKVIESRGQRRSKSSSSSSSDEEFIKSPSPGALARLNATRPSGLVKALLGGDDSTNFERPTEDSSCSRLSDGHLATDGEVSCAAGDEGKQVSSDMLSKVRAMLKASRKAVLKEDSPAVDS